MWGEMVKERHCTWIKSTPFRGGPVLFAKADCHFLIVDAKLLTDPYNPYRSGTRDMVDLYRFLWDADDADDDDADAAGSGTVRTRGIIRFIKEPNANM